MHYVLQLCSISALVTFTRFIENKGFNSLEGFGVMDGDTGMLETMKYLASRSIATRMKLWKVKIKGLQALVWWIHDRQTHNQPLIVDDF